MARITTRISRVGRHIWSWLGRERRYQRDEGTRWELSALNHWNIHLTPAELNWKYSNVFIMNIIGLIWILQFFGPVDWTCLLTDALPGIAAFLAERQGNHLPIESVLKLCNSAHLHMPQNNRVTQNYNQGTGWPLQTPWLFSIVKRCTADNAVNVGWFGGLGSRQVNDVDAHWRVFFFVEIRSPNRQTLAC